MNQKMRSSKITAKLIAICFVLCILNELRGVSSGDETLCRMLDITSQKYDFSRKN